MRRKRGETFSTPHVGNVRKDSKWWSLSLSLILSRLESYVLSTQILPVVTSCKSVIQNHNQDIDIETVEKENNSISTKISLVVLFEGRQMR
jgi:hypothetical protein